MVVQEDSYKSQEQLVPSPDFVKSKDLTPSFDYTVKYGNKVYVLHVFQKKSRRGIATPQADMDVINSRLKEVKELEGVKS